MEYLSIDDVINNLNHLKECGMPGDTPVVFPSRDNNMRGGVVERASALARVPVGKSDMDKGYNICKLVASRGVEVVVIR